MRIVRLIGAFLLAASSIGCAQAHGVAAIAISDDTQIFGDYLSAHFAADHHDFAEAARFYDAALDQDPNNPDLLMPAFSYTASAGDMVGAAKLAERVVAAVPDNRAARLVLAVTALKRHDYKDARAQIAKSAQGPFTSFTVALIDAWAAAGQDDAKTAAADLKTLHAQQAADGLAYFNEAMVAELLGDKTTADADYQAALKASGPTPRVIDAYGRFLERNGRTEEARALYMKLSSDGGFAPIIGPALARIASGTKPEPLVASAEGGAAEALFGIGASLNDDTSRDVSIFYLRLALYLQPKLDLATILLADRFESLEKYDDAIEAYRGVAHDSPYYRMAAVEVAVDLARLDKTDEAIADLKALTIEFPQDIETWTALGDTYRQAQNFPDAVKAYDSAIKASGTPDKKEWPLFYARAIAEQQTDNWPAAEADLKQALTLSPDQPQVLNYLGYSWVDKGRNIKEALGMLEKARKLAPQDGYIIDSVGWAYYRLGRYKEAVNTLEDAIQLVPGDPTINDHLGDAYWRIGRRLDAKFQWNHALAFGPEAAEKSKIEKKLQAGLNRDDRS
ncbi:MAG: tetratricopeptide repeat protein [Alphaproteobacteria bacterium]|nr:tetratricopeptide repeat protein [Alphaproteobacteria bacterium]